MGEEPLLSATGLGRSFGGLRAVDEVGFDVPTGEVLGIVGPNGAGKSTLFALLSGFVPPDDGSVLFAGEDITRLGAAQVSRRGLCRTFQIPQPFLGLSVRENVMAGAYRHGRSRARARSWADSVLERVGLAEVADARSDALNVPQRKRLELARTCATRPRMLLLDEVSAGLTAPEQADFVTLVRDLNTQDGTTVVFVEHILPVVRALASRVLVLSQGRVLSVGTYDEAMSDPAVVVAYLGESHADRP